MIDRWLDDGRPTTQKPLGAACLDTFVLRTRAGARPLAAAGAREPMAKAPPAVCSCGGQSTTNVAAGFGPLRPGCRP